MKLLETLRVSFGVCYTHVFGIKQYLVSIRLSVGDYSTGVLFGV